MPIYEYKCQSCGERHEKLQKYSDPLCKKCPHCGGLLKKLISSPAIQFKGSGFYITDYAKKNSPSEEKEDQGRLGPQKSRRKQAGRGEARRGPDRPGQGGRQNRAQDRGQERAQAGGQEERLLRSGAP